MPSGKQRVKLETRVPKVSCRKANGRLKETELSGCGSLKDVKDASLVFDLSDSQSRWVVLLGA